MKNTKQVDLPKMLFEEIAPKYVGRNGGFKYYPHTELLKRGQQRFI